jgi:hypothetical protein
MAYLIGGLQVGAAGALLVGDVSFLDQRFGSRPGVFLFVTAVVGFLGLACCGGSSGNGVSLNSSASGRGRC